MSTKSTAPNHDHTTPSATPRKAPRTLAGNPQPSSDPTRKTTLGLYESALKLMQSGKFDKAHEAFLKMLADAPPDLAERIRMYIAACVSQINKGTTTFQSHEERYDYAISLLNHGHYEDAREHFHAILLDHDSADYAFYGLALLAGMTGNSEQCIEHLTEAIRLNSQNRLLARNDSDFDAVADDPRFTELLYPDS
jgi:TolA-binding protein